MSANLNSKEPINSLYRVEFNTSDFHNGSEVWETADEFAEIEATSEKEAIKFAKDWLIEQFITSGDMDYDEAVDEVNSTIWRAFKIEVDDDNLIN